MFVQKQNFIFNCNEEDENFVNSLNVEEIYNKVKNFFNFKKDIMVKVKFLYSIEEFNFFNKHQFQNWMCGFTMPNNIIFVFSPSVVEDLTIHKRNEIKNIIIHELAHIFYGNIGFPQITLFNEGIATYLSFYEREISYDGSNTKIDLLELIQKNNSPEIYHISFLVVKKMIDTFGKDKFLLFLHKLKESKDFNKEFGFIFKSVFGISVEDFNNIF